MQSNMACWKFQEIPPSNISQPAMFEYRKVVHSQIDQNIFDYTPSSPVLAGKCTPEKYLGVLIGCKHSTKKGWFFIGFKPLNNDAPMGLNHKTGKLKPEHPPSHTLAGVGGEPWICQPCLMTLKGIIHSPLYIHCIPISLRVD